MSEREFDRLTNYALVVMVVLLLSMLAGIFDWHLWLLSALVAALGWPLVFRWYREFFRSF